MKVGVSVNSWVSVGVGLLEPGFSLPAPEFLVAAVGTTGVFVGGLGVAVRVLRRVGVGGTGVFGGGTGVSVKVGGTGVFVMRGRRVGVELGGAT